MADHIKFSVPGKPEYIGTVRLAISSLASTAGFDVEEIEDIKAAVTEVCTNLFCRNISSFRYEVNCELSERGLSISIRDEEEIPAPALRVAERPAGLLGSPASKLMNMMSDPFDFSGFELGMMLVEALMDEVDAPSLESNRRRIRMIKYHG